MCEGNPRDNQGRLCEACDGKGYFEITQCPNQLVDRELAECLPLVDLFVDNGLPPVAGGVLDQSKWFLDFVRRVKSDDNRLRSVVKPQME